jgi:hypothetical protein
VGVSTLFLAQRIRSSEYLSMLASELPELRGTRPGDEIDIPDLPELRRLVVVENDMSPLLFHDEICKAGIRAFTDFREILVWDESSREHSIMNDLERGLTNNEIINLQFTRYAPLLFFANPIDVKIVVLLAHLKPFQYVYSWPFYFICHS